MGGTPPMIKSAAEQALLLEVTRAGATAEGVTFAEIWLYGREIFDDGNCGLGEGSWIWEDDQQSSFEDTSGAEDAWRGTAVQCNGATSGGACSQQEEVDHTCQNYRFWSNWPASCALSGSNRCQSFGPSGSVTSHPMIGYSNWDANEPGQSSDANDGDRLKMDAFTGKWRASKRGKTKWIVCEGICPPSAPPTPPPAPPPLLPYPPSPPCETIVVTLYNPCRCKWADFSVSVGEQVEGPFDTLIDGDDVFTDVSFCIYAGQCYPFIIGPDAPSDLSWYTSIRATEVFLRQGLGNIDGLLCPGTDYPPPSPPPDPSSPPVPLPPAPAAGFSPPPPAPPPSPIVPWPSPSPPVPPSSPTYVPAPRPPPPSPPKAPPNPPNRPGYDRFTPSPPPPSTPPPAPPPACKDNTCLYRAMLGALGQVHNEFPELKRAPQ